MGKKNNVEKWINVSDALAEMDAQLEGYEDEALERYEDDSERYEGDIYAGTDQEGADDF
jgi:hypothetical protein